MMLFDKTAIMAARARCASMEEAGPVWRGYGGHYFGDAVRIGSTSCSEPRWATCRARRFSGFTDVYGRLRWDSPAPALTTRCISYSNGRFGHPEQDRAISVREAACLQTFPPDFVFTGNLNSQARQVGNAVPALLAQQFGERITSHLAEIVVDAGTRPDPSRNMTSESVCEAGCNHA